jgi:hypothetical protein
MANLNDTSPHKRLSRHVWPWYERSVGETKLTTEMIEWQVEESRRWWRLVEDIPLVEDSQQLEDSWLLKDSQLAVEDSWWWRIAGCGG